MSLADLLSSGKVDEFNAKRPRRGTVDLFAADLAGAHLAGADLSGVDLQKADLSEADLSDAILARADLRGADLTGANFRGAVCIRIKLREAYLGGCDLSGANLSGADLSEAELPGAHGTEVVLTAARMHAADLSRACLPGADLREAQLNEVTATGADLSGATMTEARLRKANLSGAILKGADLTHARLCGATLANADLSGAILKGADLSGADLARAHLEGADLTRADLSEVELDGIDLSVATTTDAELAPSGLPAELRAPPEEILVEDANTAVNGDRMAALWDNPEGGSALRIAIGPLDAHRPPPAMGLPVPGDLVRARGLVAHSDGFAALVLLERPSGQILRWFPFDANGEPGPTASLRLPYAPAVAPLLRASAEGPLLFGISREGPTVHVHRIGAEGLEPMHSGRLPTARGFVSRHAPLILTKGGTLVELRQHGTGPVVTAPADFPGRAWSAAPLADGIALTWVLRGEPGFRVARVLLDGTSTAETLFDEDVIGTVDVAVDPSVSESGPQGLWVAFTRIEPDGATASAWVLRLPGDTARELLPGEEIAPTGAWLMPREGTHPLAVLITAGGTLRVVDPPRDPERAIWGVP